MPKVETVKVVRQSSMNDVSPKKEASQKPIDGYAMKAIFYGETKKGKTRLASTFPKPMLMIGLEDGTASIASSKQRKGTLSDGTVIDTLLLRNQSTGIDFVRVNKISTVSQILEISHNYKTVVFDTLGGLQDLVYREVLGYDDMPLSKSYGEASFHIWGQIVEDTQKIVKPFLLLHQNQGINLVFLAHERIFEGKEREDIKISSKIGPDLSPKLARWICAECDYIGQCCFVEQTLSQKVVIAGQEQVEKVRTGKYSYSLRIGPHPLIFTGFRVLPGGDDNLPEFVENPTYLRLYQLIHGE